MAKRRVPTTAIVLTAIVGLALGTGAAVWAATSSQQADAPAPSPTSTDVPASARPTPTVSADSPDDVSTEPLGEAAWDDASRASVVAAAEAAMTAYAQPTITQEQWWSTMQPLLTQNAAFDYAYVQPASIPATTLTGSGTIVEDTSVYVATVEVPTDAGTYGVLLTRTGGDAPWLVSRFIVPESAP